jgi:hypothetical protein
VADDAGLTIDDHEVVALSRDLLAAAQAAPEATRKIVAKGALNIKRDAQRRVTGLAHAPAYPRAITYDSHQSLTGAWAEIGPDKDRRQGALGNLLEYGSVHNQPTPHMGPAGEAEKPRFEKAMQDLAAKVLGP